MMEWAAVAAIATLGGFGLAFATFWLTFGGRIGSAESIATQARLDAKEALEEGRATARSLADYKEHIAKEYIHRESMREVEDRLTSTINRLGDRFDEFFKATIAALAVKVGNVK